MVTCAACFAISGTKVTAATFTVDMTTVRSGQDQRDSQFQGRIMDTSQFPTATFELTKPIDLAPVPKDGTIKMYPATGKLMLHGTTKTVTIPLNTKRVGDVIQVQGILSINFPDYNVNNPSGGPASVGDVGQLEFVFQEIINPRADFFNLAAGQLGQRRFNFFNRAHVPKDSAH